ncbi:MAG: glycine betaine ABC transporter substrate-binding protein [Bryobacterales bacterium]
MLERLCIFLLLLLTACGLLLTSCGRDGSSIVVGSKNFTESVVLAELIAQQIEARTDLRVERRLNLGGTFLTHQALVAGQIDIYPEYSGTALTAILEQPVTRDPAEVLRIVSEAYRQQFHAEWLAPFGFNNTYAIVVREEDADQKGLKTLSDLAAVSSEFVIGFMFEFSERQDGYRGLVETYGMSFKDGPRTMDLGLIYRALRDGQIDVGVGSATDGLISALKMRVLEDDKRYFPPYDAAPVARTAALDEHPELRESLGALGGILTEQEMRQVNYAVDGEQRPVKDVVRELRERKGL